MKYTDKEFIALVISFFLFMVAIGWQWMFGYPTDSQLAFASIVWMVAACISGLYSWYLEKDDAL